MVASVYNAQLFLKNVTLFFVLTVTEDQDTNELAQGSPGSPVPIFDPTPTNSPINDHGPLGKSGQENAKVNLFNLITS